MKLIGALLTIVSLGLGVLAAATAYLVHLDLPLSQLEGLTLAATAAALPLAGEEQTPVAVAGTRLTPALVEQLRRRKVEYVRVKEFSLSRWPGRWVFAGSLAGLAVGGGLMRVSARRQLARAGDLQAGKTPEESLEDLAERIEQLRQELVANGRGALRSVLAGLSGAQQTCMADFVASRPRLIARLGMSGFAEVMDRYAAMERQLHRAWSATADGFDREVQACLDEAGRLLQATRERLGAVRPG